MKKLLFVFTSGRKKRLLQKQAQLYPKEFFFGIPFLRQEGFKLDILEIKDLCFEKKSIQYRLLFFFGKLVSMFTGLTSSSHFFYKSQDFFRDYDVIVSCNEYIALGVLYLKLTKKIKGDHIFFVMGMLAKISRLEQKNRFFYLAAKKIYQTLIENSKKVIFIGQGEFVYAKKKYAPYKKKFEFIPFPVDNEFWEQTDHEHMSFKDYILFVGNDRQRDFECVVKIVKQMHKTKFVIISKNNLFSCLLPYPNVTVINGDWNSLSLSDEQIRWFYQNADLVILPLKSTLQPSGQSAALQAMACATPVMISKTAGFWEPGVFKHKQHLIFIESRDHEAWVQAIKNFLAQKKNLVNVGIQSQKLVHVNNSLEGFGRKLVDVLNGQ